MSDSFSVDVARLGLVPQAVAAARDALGAVRVDDAAGAAAAACGSTPGARGVTAVARALAAFVAAGTAALDDDGARLRRTVGAYGSVDALAAQASASIVASSFSGGR